MKSPAPGLSAAFGFAAGLCVLAPSVRAQAAPADSAQPEESPVKMEKFEVTGTYIPLARAETALPVTLLDTKAIENTGIATNVLEVLRKAAPQFSGNGNLGNSNANVDLNSTGGGSKLAFRNTQTLVLVNGRRMTYSPILGSGGFQYVDVNLIPLSAIERIEVLQDGASATYGSDAVAGVVNIILKTNFTGLETAARYAVSTNTGHYAERSFAAVGGAGSDKTAVTLSAEYTAIDPLFQYERGFSSPIYGTSSFGGVINTPAVPNLPQYYILNPVLNAPPAGHTDLATLVAQGIYIPVSQSKLMTGTGDERKYAFNLADYVTLLLENRRRNATVNFEHRVNDRLSLFGDVIATRTETFSQLNALPLMGSLAPTNPSNPATQTMIVRNRFVTHPRFFRYDSKSLRVIAGARGRLGADWHWEAAADYNRINQGYTNQNAVDSTLRAAAINNGLINLAARQQAPGAIEAAGFFGTAWDRATSTLTTGDARVNGELGALPAGPVGFAVGTEYRVETLKQSADKNSQTTTLNWDSPVAIDPFAHDRNVWSSFAEVRLPLLGEKQRVPWVHALDLGVAVRHERYSDTDDPTVPKFSLAWRPRRDEWLLRATYSRSFAAPTLFNLFGPTTLNDEAVDFFDSVAGERVARKFHVRGGSNPALLPSRSRNFTAGFVWSPRAWKGLSVTTDIFAIKQIDLVSTIGADTILQDVELKGAASPYARFVTFDGFKGTAIAAPGRFSADATGNIYVTDTLVNIASQQLKGADVKAEYARSIAAWGRFTVAAVLSGYKTYTYQTLPSLPAIETAGYATAYNGTIPRWQGDATLGWSRGGWRANVNWQHIPGVADPRGDGSVRKPFAIETYDAFDVATAYTFDSRWRWFNRLTLRVGANNVFNATPPFGGGTFGSANADIATYSPIGRLLFAEARYKF